jgi:plastocyanin
MKQLSIGAVLLSVASVLVVGGLMSATQSRPAMTIAVQDSYFQPPILQVMPGDTVRWVNHGRHTHTVTLQSGQDYPLAPGASVSLTFPGPGRFAYYCRFHPLQGMRGVILVGGTSSEASELARKNLIEGGAEKLAQTTCQHSR